MSKKTWIIGGAVVVALIGATVIVLRKPLAVLVVPKSF